MYNDLRKIYNKGFSLVELIVVIAIMAVMTAVLAPSLLQYVEKSRAQKDNSAMGEVVQVVKLALADQDVYDECLCYTVNKNYNKYIVTKDAEGKELTDETPWAFAGEMRGLRITFQPKTKGANDTKFVLAEGKVNMDYAGGDAKAYNGGDITSTLETMTSGSTTGELYNRVLAGIGSEVKLTSQTYRNSDYTIFITMGAADEAISVYGQWGGTNLSADGSAGENPGGGQPGGEVVTAPLHFGEKYYVVSSIGEDSFVVSEDGMYGYLVFYEDGSADFVVVLDNEGRHNKETFPVGTCQYTDEKIILAGEEMSISSDGEVIMDGMFILESALGKYGYQSPGQQVLYTPLSFGNRYIYNFTDSDQYLYMVFYYNGSMNFGAGFYDTGNEEEITSAPSGSFYFNETSAVGETSLIREMFVTISADGKTIVYDGGTFTLE